MRKTKENGKIASALMVPPMNRIGPLRSLHLHGLTLGVRCTWNIPLDQCLVDQLARELYTLKLVVTP